MTVAAGPFVAKIPRENSFPFIHEADAILVGNFIAIRRFVSTIPYAEDYPPLSLRIHLHPKIPTMPTTCHIERPNRLFDRLDFGVKRIDFGTLLGDII